ncbi:MAG: acetate--CoA ligase family protein, partial [Armatimonadota bacterium]
SFILQEGRGGHEVMIGAKRDPIFGFQIIFTPEGGKYAEIAAKVAAPSVRVGRITAEEALSMIKEHSLSAKIMGARGEAPADLKALAELISNLSQMMDENPDVQELDLNPVFVDPDGIHMVDARVETKPAVPMAHEFFTNRSLKVFKAPKKALVVIASASRNSVGQLLFDNVSKIVKNVCVMLPSGKGIDYLRQKEVEIVDDVPDGCDLLIYAGLPTSAPEIVGKFSKKGGAGAIIISSDFAETGNKELEQQLKESAGTMPYIGPNCVGVYSSGLNTLFFDPKRTAYPEVHGKMALFSQSGGLCLETFSEYMSIRNIPVNEIFSLGNGSGISFTELFNSVAENDSVDIIVLHLEGGLKEGEGPYFIEALKKASSVKPVIILPAGLSSKGRQCAASHTGRITSGADALMAALRQGGATIVKNEEELRLVLWMLHAMPRATGKPVILSTGGGKGVMSVDAAERVGLELLEKLPTEFTEKVKVSMPPFADCSQNPFDFTGSVTLDGLLSILEHSKMIGSPGIFHVFMSVPRATTSYAGGKATKLSEVDAIEKIARTIKDKNLPLALNICAQSQVGRDMELHAEKQGVVVTREAASDLIMRSLKRVIEVWRRYPKIGCVTETVDSATSM